MSSPHHRLGGEVVAARRGFFWVGARPTPSPHGTIQRGQMYVEWMAPPTASRPYPIVLVHGGGGQGLDWLGTPDGRPGWAIHLLQAGFVVYVVDRPGHGRSPYHPDVLGPMSPPASYEALRPIFTPGGALGEDHTQWPEGREAGDEAMDQFMAGSGPMLADPAAAHALEGAILAELLDRVGPAIVFSHSAGAPGAFVATDAHPESVAALVAIEPIGPPFLDRPELGMSLSWGVASAPLTYAPAVTRAADLNDGVQRRLINLAKVPIAVVSSPHSPIAQGDPATVQHLRHAGCTVEHVQLDAHGVLGNGHGMMLEINNRQALQVILDWLTGRSVV